MDHSTRRRSARRRAALLACLATPLLAVPAAPAGARADAQRAVVTPAAGAVATETRELVLDFDGAVAGGEGTPVRTAGRATTSASVRTHSVGRVGVADHPGAGQALRLPAFAPGATAGTIPMAVVVVTATGAALDPRAADFVLRASVRLDTTTTGTATDNGDNLVQRGSFASPAQMKLQVDRRRPSCRVKGAAGTVVVKGTVRLRAGVWFDLTCRRTSSGVILKQRRVLDDGSVVRRSWTGTGPTGSLSALPDSVPLTVGGKTDVRGVPTAQSSDQLNGVVDQVVFDILP